MIPKILSNSTSQKERGSVCHTAKTATTGIFNEKICELVIKEKALETVANRKITDFFEGTNDEPADGVDDGKISFGNAAKNFLRGLVSPITSMFKSAKNLLIGAGMLAGGALLTVVTGGAAAPVLVAIGIMTGIVNVGVGAYKACTATTDKDAELAWQGIGSGTSAVVLSVAGAKSALQASGVNTSNMNAVKATATCMKIAPDAAVTGAKNISTSIKGLLSNTGSFFNTNDGSMPQLAVAGDSGLRSSIQNSGATALQPVLVPSISVAGTATAAVTSAAILSYSRIIHPSTNYGHGQVTDGGDGMATYEDGTMSIETLNDDGTITLEFDNGETYYIQENGDVYDANGNKIVGKDLKRFEKYQKNNTT